MKKFIKVRTNKDNFWNLMFWLGMVLGWSVTSFFGKEYSTAAFICLWSTILGIPYLVKINSRVTFDKEKGFFSKDGRSLENSYPRKFGLVIFIAIGVVVLLGLIFDKNLPKLDETVSSLLLFSSFFLVITLYFILINCPISILFNKHIFCSKALELEAYELNHNHSNFLTSNSHSSALSPRSWSTNPGYKHLSSNIHHRR